MPYESVFFSPDDLTADNVNRLQNNVSSAMQELLFEIEELKKRIKTLEENQQ